MKKKADLIIDLQYGSTGKGAIAGYLAATRDYDLVINANMPNAGHTYIDKGGAVMMHKVLPNGVVGPHIKDVILGPGSIFDPAQLQKELHLLEALGYDRWNFHIHENACVVTDYDKEQEQRHMADIGSTCQGTSVVMVNKIKRNKMQDPTAKTRLKGTPFECHLITNAEYLNKIDQAERILLEGAQGYSLGINAGFFPFCTSRDCTPARFCADMNIPMPMINKVIGTARMHPIRVGGNSGPCYEDQMETTWEVLGVEKEYTTVTGRERRVFTWSQQQILDAMFVCQPDEVFLNFCNYDPKMVPIIRSLIDSAARSSGCEGHVRYEGWGANHGDIKEQMELYKDG